MPCSGNNHQQTHSQWASTYDSGSPFTESNPQKSTNDKSENIAEPGKAPSIIDKIFDKFVVSGNDATDEVSHHRNVLLPPTEISYPSFMPLAGKTSLKNKNLGAKSVDDANIGVCGKHSDVRSCQNLKNFISSSSTQSKPDDTQSLQLILPEIVISSNSHQDVASSASAIDELPIALQEDKASKNPNLLEVRPQPSKQTSPSFDWWTEKTTIEGDQAIFGSETSRMSLWGEDLTNPFTSKRSSKYGSSGSMKSDIIPLEK